MKVICYGDSNTYGYDPRSYIGGRYPAGDRWVDLLAEKTGWEVENRGMNGREIPGHSISVPSDSGLLIVMLGTNDLLQGADAATTAGRMERFLEGLPLDRKKILLVAPPSMQRGGWVTEQALIDQSIHLTKNYCDLAQRLGIGFADAGEWLVELCYDGVHFTANGHRAFAEGLMQAIKSLLII